MESITQWIKSTPHTFFASDQNISQPNGFKFSTSNHNPIITRKWKFKFDVPSVQTSDSTISKHTQPLSGQTKKDKSTTCPTPQALTELTTQEIHTNCDHQTMLKYQNIGMIEKYAIHQRIFNENAIGPGHNNPQPMDPILHHYFLSMSYHKVIPNKQF